MHITLSMICIFTHQFFLQISWGLKKVFTFKKVIFKTWWLHLTFPFVLPSATALQALSHDKCVKFYFKILFFFNILRLKLYRAFV